jgi:hypothetical protein
MDVILYIVKSAFFILLGIAFVLGIIWILYRWFWRKTPAVPPGAGTTTSPSTPVAPSTSVGWRTRRPWMNWSFSRIFGWGGREPPPPVVPPGTGTVTTRTPASRNATPEEVFWLSRAPHHLVEGRAVKRAVTVTVILLIVAVAAWVMGIQEGISLSPGVRSAVTATVAIPSMGLLVTVLLTFATAAWIDPRALMFFVIVFSAITVVALAMFTEGYLPCVWEIPQWGPVMHIPVPIFIVLLTGVIYTLVGTERFGAIIVLLLFLLISIWPNFVSQGVNEGKLLCHWLI